MKTGMQKQLYILLVLMGLCINTPKVEAIQILENTVTRNGVVVSDTLSIGITAPQLLHGSIDGFLINLFLFPIVGPLPEIKLLEINLAGAETIGVPPQSARWVFNQSITQPVTVTASLDVDFHTLFPVGTIATYELSSLGSNLEPIETLSFDVAAHQISEPSTGFLLIIALVGWLGCNWRRQVRIA